MKSLRLIQWLELCALCCMSLASPAQASERTAFYYGARVPTDLLAAYDEVVVEPEHVVNLEDFSRGRARPVAYLSVGEVARSGEQAKHVQPAWVAAQNLTWASQVMDLTHEGYRAYLMRRFDELWRAGYQRFFLDTLDSYLIGASAEQAERARRALVEIVLEMKRRHPSARLSLNRGFEILPEVKAHVSGVVAESLYDRWDAARRRYTRVPAKDRSWLLGQLRRVRDEYGLPVTVIDYRPPAERSEARATARKIQALGFEPWVSDAALQSVGIGGLEILPRRILILTNGPEPTGDREPDALRLLAPVIEYLGYVPEHRRVPERLSELGLEAGYQGVITWFSSSAVPAGYAAWMREQIERGVRFAVFGVPGFDVAGPDALALGISRVAPGSSRAVQVLARDALVGFEAEPPQRPFDGPLIRLAQSTGTRVHLELMDGAGQRGAAIATTPWGGLATSHVLSLRGLEGERAWVLDPFAFLARALALPQAPMPTVTTYNGRRLGMVLVRPQGLGLPSAHARAPSGDALGRWLTENHAWPHSLAAAPEADPQLSADDRKAARRLLSLPFFMTGDLHPGSTRAGAATASLTGVSGMLAGAEPCGPIAGDSVFLPPGGPQAYPYRDVVKTLDFTEAPRRLKPVLLDYHGYMAASPGGRRALAAVYARFAREQLFPLYVEEYAELTRAFGVQVVARGLDGSFRYFGGEPLATVRVPVELGLPRLSASRGVASVRSSGDGVYVSFVPGAERQLTLGAERLDAPHIIQATGHVLGVEVEPGSSAEVRLSVRLQGHGPLSFELGGLPAAARCELLTDSGAERASTSEDGSLLVHLKQKTSGEVRVRCRRVNGDE